MEESDGVQKPVVVDPPHYNEAPPLSARRQEGVVAAVAAGLPAENQLIQRIQRALVELRALRNEFDAIFREMELEVGVGEEEDAKSSVEDPEDASDS